MVVLGGCLAIVLLSAVLCLPDGDTVSLDAAGEFPIGPLCMLRQLTGLNCPGCGLTRSFVSCGHFRTGPAYRYHRVGAVPLDLALMEIPFRALRLT